MILSHKHKFVFIKTRKTAGTSIEVSLSRYCGPDDIITPISLRDEALRGQFGIAPQNYLGDGSGRDPSSQGQPLRRLGLRVVSKCELYREDSVPYRIKKGLVGPRGPGGQGQRSFYNHMPLSEVQEQVDEALLKSYFIFTFERNPFDKVVSDYWYRASDRTMDEYLEEGPLPVDFPKYSIDDRVAVDFVGRFENLRGDLQTALHHVGLEFDGWLPRAKSGSRKSTFTVQDLTPQQRERIRSEFRREIEEFDYSFPSRGP